MLPSPSNQFLADRVLDDFGEVTAAVGHIRKSSKGSFLSRLRGQQTVVEAIRHADENGPGVVGFYLDLKSDVLGLLDFRLQQWDRVALKWQWSSHPAASSAIATDLVGTRGERLEDFARKFSRELETAGELGFAPIEVPVPGRNPDGSQKTVTRYGVFSLDKGSYEVLEKHKGSGKPKTIGFRGAADAKKPRSINDARADEDWVVVDADLIVRIYNPHPRWFSEPYTPLARALNDIRRFDNAGRAVHRGVVNQILNSGFLWFKGSPKDLVQNIPQTRRNRGREEVQLGWLGEQINSILDAGERSLMDYEETDTRSALWHPIVTEEEPPRVIDAKQPIDPNLLNVKRDALEDFARSVNIPMSILIEGQGSAQRLLNEWLQDKAFKQTSVMPSARMVAGGLTVGFLHPRLRAVAARQPNLFIEQIADDVQVQIPETDFRIWPDETSITQDEPEIADVAEAVKAGVLRREAWSEALDGQDHFLELPDDVSEWDWFQTFNQRRAREYDHDVDQAEEQPSTRASVGWFADPFNE